MHWYGDSEGQARRFGELTAEGVARAEQLLGTRLAGPVDVFVYDTREDFFGALGPGGAGVDRRRRLQRAADDLHVARRRLDVVPRGRHAARSDPHRLPRRDRQPVHEPARWLNEGIATWAERSDADDERAIVQLEAGGGGLFAFEAITEQFPIGERGGRLSYAQGASMVDLIVRDHGEAAIAAMAAAYREGASDTEALEAGTGVAAADLYASFYAEFGADAPQAIRPDPIPPSNVDRPTPGRVDQGGVDPGVERPPDDGAPIEGEPAPASDPGILVLLGLVAASVLGAALLVARRGAGRAP